MKPHTLDNPPLPALYKFCVPRVSLRSEKYQQNIDRFRGFIEKFCLFLNRSEDLYSPPLNLLIHIQWPGLVLTDLLNDFLRKIGQDLTRSLCIIQPFLIFPTPPPHAFHGGCSSFGPACDLFVAVSNGSQHALHRRLGSARSLEL